MACVLTFVLLANISYERLGSHSLFINKGLLNLMQWIRIKLQEAEKKVIWKVDERDKNI
jgi:hypothetical protein